MDVFIAGAGGAIGRALIPLLVAEGHTVTGTTTTAAKRAAIEALGARAVVMDGLDAGSVMEAVRGARPDVLLHQVTALGGQDMTKMDRAFATTNRLRTEGLDHLLAAAAQLDAPPRVLVQSFAGVPLARTGDRVKDETAPLDPDPPKGMRETVAAFRAMETRATEAGAIVLRYGGFYGPHTGLTAGGEQAELLRHRRFPIVGGGAGVWSLVHVEDAAEATVAAIERGRPGEIYHVVDDEPAPVREWLPLAARAAGAKPPLRVPAWVGRLAAGPAAVELMTNARGASNAKAKRELGWQPRHATWRTGLPEALGG